MFIATNKNCWRLKNAISDNEDDDKHDRHDMDVLRTFHKADFRDKRKEKRIVESFCLACINVVLFNKRNEKRNGKSLVGMGRGHLICKFVVSLVNLNEKEKN